MPLGAQIGIVFLMTLYVAAFVAITIKCFVEDDPVWGLFCLFCTVVFGVMFAMISAYAIF